MSLMIVDKPVVDMRRTSRPSSERTSQLLFNQTVRAVEERSGYVLVVSDDGYKGWVKSAHLTHAEPISASHFVSVPIAAVFDESGRFCDKLSFGTKLAVNRASEDFGRIEFGSACRYISYGCVTRVPSAPRKWPTIRRSLEMLIGTPYLWGGRSGFGMDCSGMVQLVFNSLGYSQYRDSNDQRKKGRTVSIESVRPGDLIFSPGHVCVYYGRGKIIHASARAGGLYIENLMPTMPDARGDIYETIELVKRLVR
jgi:hypothetical protein